MPKLPEIDYAVVTQGPPNTMQAWGSVAGAFDQLSDIGHRAAMAFAEEQAKTQRSEASLLLEQGLGQVETALTTKPYLSRKEVLGAFGDAVPPDVRQLVDAAPDDESPTIETWRVGPAIHQAAARRLAEDAAPRISAPKVRADFEQRAAAETLQRSIRFEQRMVAQGVELNKAKTLALAEARASEAVTEEEWNRVVSDVQGSGWLSPAEKLVALKKLEDLRVARPIYDAIRTEDPAAIREQIARVDNDQEMSGVSPETRKVLKGQLKTALSQVEAQAERDRVRAEREAGDNALNRALSLQSAVLAGKRVTAAEWLSVMPKPGTVSPQVLEHVNTMVANAIKPKAEQIKTDLGVYALVQNSRVTNPDEWAQGVVVLPNGKKTSVLALHAGGGLSLEDAKSLTKDQAESFAKPDTVRPDALQAGDKAEVDRLLETQYRYKLDKKAGEYLDQESGKIAGWMYKVVESELAAEARKAPGGRLEVDQRNAIIRKTLAREVQVEPGTLYGTNQKVSGMPIPPEFDTAFHRLPTVAGRPTSHEFLAKKYEDWVGKYQAAADEVWRAQTRGQALRADDAVRILAILDTRKAQIDEELKRAGQFTANEGANDVKRAALATRYYFNSGIWRRR